ncbi:MAG TPA: nucleotide exchange factor GrpE [Azospirillaceae bacterium]|nr:nucleotide exchange factor GrpE [Azospirillaceae bacterium]
MSDTEKNPAETIPETDATQAAPQANGASNGAEQPAAGGYDPDAGMRATLLEAEVASLKDQLMRAMAETENTRRRAQKEREDTAKYAVSNFAKELLAVADNLRRAVEAVPAETRQGNEQVNNLLIGVEATERQLAASFERAGIVRMEPQGQPFDPNFHQVIAEVDSSQPQGSVVQVLQAGYTIHGRLLREAMVMVSKGNLPAAEAPKAG